MPARARFELIGLTTCLVEVRATALVCATRPAEPHAPRELWSAIVDGAVSVVDAFNARGHRLIVARRNPSALRRRLALTERQATMLRAIAEGRTNKEVEALLNIRPSTASTHVTLLLAKLGMRSRAEVARRFGSLVQLSR